MGLYTDRIVLHVSNMPEIKWPLPIKLSIFLRFKFELTEKYPNKYEFEYFLNNKSIIKLSGEINKIEKTQPNANIAITGGIPLEPGHLGFSVKLFDENNLLFSEKNINAIKILTE